MSTVAQAGAPARPQRAPDRRVAVVLLAVVVVVVVVFDYAIASRSFFFGDDIVIFFQGKAQGLSLDYLTSPTIGAHFAPGVRLLSYGLQRVAPLNWDVGLALVLAFLAAAVVLQQRLLAALFGERWWTFALALAFGLSLIEFSRVVWFSAAVQGIPAVALALACIHAHVVWLRTRRGAWLVWSVLALCGALLFYESAALVPVWLVLFHLLLLREHPRDLARSWRAWLLYAVPVLALIVVVATGAYETGGTPALDDVPDYLWHAWIDGFAPAVFGVRVPLFDQTTAHHLAVLGAQVAIVAAVAISVARRRSAWRAWAFLGLAFLLNALLVLPRLQTFGPGIAFDTRYYTETAYLVPLAVAFAFAVPERHAGRQLRWPRPAAAAAVGVALAAYIGVVVWGDSQTVDASTGRKVRPWVDRVRAGLERAERTDPQPALLDAPAPDAVVGPFFPPPRAPCRRWCRWSTTGRASTSPAAATYRVAATGTLQPVTFVPAYTLAAPGCVTGGALRVQPPQPLPRGRQWWLRADYTSPGPVALMPNAGAGSRRALFGLPAAPRGASAYAAMQPLPRVPGVVGADLASPAGVRACFRRVQLGSFHPTGPPL